MLHSIRQIPLTRSNEIIENTAYPEQILTKFFHHDGFSGEEMEKALQPSNFCPLSL